MVYYFSSKSLQINCVTRGTGRASGVSRSTSIRADIAVQHPIQRDFKQPKPWHTPLWLRVQGRFAPPNLESKAAWQRWERWLLEGRGKHRQHPCHPLLHAGLGDAVPGQGRWASPGEQEVSRAAERSCRNGRSLHTLPQRGES